MSVNDEGAPDLNTAIFTWNVPILGICLWPTNYSSYQCTQIAWPRQTNESLVVPELLIDEDHALFTGIKDATTVWMSHGDHLNVLPRITA